MWDESTKMWDKDKEACPNEGESNSVDSKEKIEVTSMMENDL